MPSQELLKREMMHALSNVLAVLGAKSEFVINFKIMEELPITEEFVKAINDYAYDEWEKVKTRLWLCHTQSVKRGDDEVSPL